MGEIPIPVPQERKSDFEPQVVPKYKRDISEIEGKVIAMYARGMSVTQISDQIRDIYGFEVSEGMVTAITNKLLTEIELWQKRQLAAVYPIVLMDAIVFNVRDSNVIRKAAAYIILGINEDGHKRDKAQDYRDECERVEVERRFSLAKRKCGMGLVTAKLRETATHAIAISILVLNLRKIQCALLRLLTYLLPILSTKKFARLFSRHYIKG